MRRGPYLLIIMLAALLPLLAHAQVTVGPDDGKQVESLPPVAMPAPAFAEKMPDFTFPQNLEKLKDFRSALIAWQRLAHDFGGADRARALMATARLNLQLGQNEAAAASLRAFLDEFPTHPRVPQAHYRLARATSGAERSWVLAAIAQQQKAAPNPFLEAALYEAVWGEANATGAVTNTYGLPRAQTLQQRLSMLHQRAAARTFAAMSFSALPGGGHIYLGQYATGGLMLTVWALFALALISACRHKHYPYAFLLALAFAAIWLTAPGGAARIAQEQNEAQRKAALAGWADLQPSDPSKTQQPDAEEIPISTILQEREGISPTELPADEETATPMEQPLSPTTPPAEPIR